MDQNFTKPAIKGKVILNSKAQVKTAGLKATRTEYHVMIKSLGKAHKPWSENLTVISKYTVLHFCIKNTKIAKLLILIPLLSSCLLNTLLSRKGNSKICPTSNKISCAKNKKAISIQNLMDVQCFC